MRRELALPTCSLCIPVKEQDCLYLRAADWPGLYVNWNTTGLLSWGKNPTQNKSKNPSSLRILALSNRKLSICPSRDLCWYTLGDTLYHHGAGLGTAWVFLDTGFAMMNPPPCILSNTIFWFLLVRHWCLVQPQAPSLAAPAALALPVSLPQCLLPLSGSLLNDAKLSSMMLDDLSYSSGNMAGKSPAWITAAPKYLLLVTPWLPSSACVPLFQSAIHNFIKNEGLKFINRGWDHAASAPYFLPCCLQSHVPPSHLSHRSPLPGSRRVVCPEGAGV